jgi:hypothetical protein
MPISAVPSGSARTHSCDLVYLRSAGMLSISDPQLPMQIRKKKAADAHLSGICRPSVL